MAPQYKLTYFNLTGLGEPIRLLFHYGGIQFVDQRVSQDQWAALKPTTPLGQLPILEVDGQVLYQSIAIARYVAKQVGLVGKTDLENWEIDAAVDTVNDLRAKIGAWYFESNTDIKRTLKESLDKEILPFLLQKLESWASQNGGHLAAKKLTWADFFFAAIIDFTTYLYGEDLIAAYPNLVTVRKNVVTIPKVKSWVDQRPKDNL